MMKTLKIVIALLVANLSVKAQCPTISFLEGQSSLPNPCTNITLNTYVLIPTLEYVEVVFDYGDGNMSSIFSISGSSAMVFTSSHSYTATGTYTATMSLDGPGVCHSTATCTFNVMCSSCPTYSNLSTGFNRAANAPFVGNDGNYDPYWYVVKKQQLTNFTYLPIPGTETYYSSTLAYDIFSYPGSHNFSGVQYISMNPDPLSVETDPNVITYRTYFNLPNPLPVSKTYSVALSMYCDDAIYEVTVNGHDIKAPGYVADGNSYSGNPLTISANSHDNPFFLPGSNYIDISVSDAALVATQLSANVMLYECEALSLPSTYCEDCIGSFSPIPGKKYLISGWVKEGSAAQSKTSYTYPSLTVKYPSLTDSSGPFFGSGDIIDGWQRIEGEFLIPALATDLNIKLLCTSGDCYFDDIRVFPFDGSMKSYVYDPVTMRLSAELDERNYATLYEYDEEGKLVRVKKETQKGIMTIKENRNNTQKQ